MFGNENVFPENWLLFPGFVRFGNGNVFPGNWFPLPGPPIFAPGSFQPFINSLTQFMDCFISPPVHFIQGK
jgi:hypothetical protein